MALTADTKHIGCIRCGTLATHIAAYIRPRGLPAKFYAFCATCPDDEYYALVTPLTARDGSPLLP